MGKRESKRQRRSKPYPHFVREDAALVLDVARKHYRRHLAKIGVLLFAGARYGEMAALQKSDILWDKRTIYVQRAWSDKTGRVQDLKNHVCRHIPLSKALAALLREHLDDFPSTGPLLFPGLAATIQWHSSFLEYVWQPLMKKTGLPYRNPHALRHTFATWALEGNLARGIRPEPIARVRDWMGHASIEETERYCHINSMGATDSLDDLYEDLA